MCAFGRALGPPASWVDLLGRWGGGCRLTFTSPFSARTLRVQPQLYSPASLSLAKPPTAESMFGFRPEPINIPQPKPSAGLHINLTAADSSIAGVPAADLSAAATSAVAAASEPFAQLTAQLQSDIQHTDLQVLHNIGHGSSGVVQKVLHVPSDSVLALKIIPVEADEAKRKAILLELKALHESSHASIVSFYGAFYREGAVHVALEYMDASLLDISRGAGVSLSEEALAAIALPVLHGLVYMHREKHIIHRDIKPSNLLVDSAGNVKIADFGVSGELHHTLAKCASWVGTVHYMSPERIQGSRYMHAPSAPGQRGSAHTARRRACPLCVCVARESGGAGACMHAHIPLLPAAVTCRMLGRLGHSMWSLVACALADPPPPPSPPSRPAIHMTRTYGHLASLC